MDDSMLKKVGYIFLSVLLLTALSCEPFWASDDIKTDKIKGYPASGGEVYFVGINVSGLTSTDYKTKTGELPGNGSGPKIIKEGKSAASRPMMLVDRYPAFGVMPSSPENTIHNLRSDAGRGRTPVSESTLSYNHIYNYWTGDSVAVDRVAGGDHVYIFCQSSKKNLVTEEQWRELVSDFDSHYETMVSVFGEPSDVDGNGKIVVTYIDMVELIGDEEKYTGGFFSFTDLYEDVYDISMGLYSCGNYMDVINMNLFAEVNEENTGPDITDLKMKSAVLHEFEHLINESQRRYLGKTMMDLWLDEGFAMTAEHLCYGRENLDYRVKYFNEYVYDSDYDMLEVPSLTIWTGSLINYSLSYLFMQYVRLQCGNTAEIYKQMLAHKYGDYRAIENVVCAVNPAFDDYEDIISGFYLANLLQNDDGKYSYKGEADQFTLTIRSPSTDVWYLFPSAVVYYKSTPNKLGDTLRLGREGRNMRYVLVADGDIYCVEEGRWVKQSE